MTFDGQNKKLLTKRNMAHMRSHPEKLNNAMVAAGPHMEIELKTLLTCVTVIFSFLRIQSAIAAHANPPTYLDKLGSAARNPVDRMSKPNMSRRYVGPLVARVYMPHVLALSVIMRLRNGHDVKMDFQGIFLWSQMGKIKQKS